MNNKCKFHKVRTKKGIRYGYCTLLKKEVSIFACNCNDKTYKEIKTTKKKRNNTIVKLERKRYSILTDNLNVCIECGKPKQELHEVYEGIYRLRSMEYGCVIPLCKEHHDLIHSNQEFKLKYKRLMKDAFISYYPNLSFNDIFYYKERGIK